MTRPLVIAHRGYSAVAPENTLAAFEAALRAGADLLELDVHLDADGVPVVVHDDTLDRTTDTRGAVGDSPSTVVRGADAGAWFAPAFAGQRVPTLKEVAGVVARFPDAGLLVEFKGAWSRAAASAAVGSLRPGGVAARSVVQSFDRSTVAALRDVAPDVRRALLVLHPGPPMGTDELERAFRHLAQDPFTALCTPAGVAREQAERAVAELGVVAVNPYVASLVASPHVIAEYHGAGVATYPYTVDEPRIWHDLLRHRVDGIITDEPGRLRGFLEAWEVRSAQDGVLEERRDLTLAAARQGRAARRLVAV
ncbi:glycerophosphoryl diester phosphodiesterase [Kineococcus radiotolerans]|uniref:Glycerophosphoryl diester phosphodiesterase n=2 Tax=Kineococcus radiotolerans TaxID=131568 RepID=A6W4P9_KINRD|nr:glycerophosphodiester phosphodiesterase family protein [Kineococcus radiotolerans]ABS01788.1 glycerophosphoryl diester phosphodiesterase [Kineococcus radiotolerans SRS30216 = ATCC BAA-149]MBB2901069.1 glycerophosphoryl diester phosphodiesterase [Kineococcus radiotolerans]